MLINPPNPVCNVGGKILLLTHNLQKGKLRLVKWNDLPRVTRLKPRAHTPVHYVITQTQDLFSSCWGRQNWGLKEEKVLQGALTRSPFPRGEVWGAVTLCKSSSHMLGGRVGLSPVIRSAMDWIVCPPQSHTETLTPHTSNVTVFGDRALTEVN